MFFLLVKKKTNKWNGWQIFSSSSSWFLFFPFSGGLAAAASEISPVIALPVVKPGSALANAAGTKIPVTLPRIQQLQQFQQQQHQQQQQ